MKEFDIDFKENELELQFYYNKSSALFYSIFFTTIFTIFFVFSKPGSVYNSWGALLVMFILALYLTTEEYFEWKKYKVQRIKKNDDQVSINNLNLYKNYNIKTVNIVYINSVSFGGWKVYLRTHYGKKDYTIKTRLKKDDAILISNYIGKFLDKEVIMDN